MLTKKSVGFMVLFAGVQLISGQYSCAPPPYLPPVIPPYSPYGCNPAAAAIPSYLPSYPPAALPSYAPPVLPSYPPALPSYPLSNCVAPQAIASFVPLPQAPPIATVLAPPLSSAPCACTQPIIPYQPNPCQSCGSYQSYGNSCQSCASPCSLSPPPDACVVLPGLIDEIPAIESLSCCSKFSSPCSNNYYNYDYDSYSPCSACSEYKSSKTCGCGPFTACSSKKSKGCGCGCSGL